MSNMKTPTRDELVDLFSTACEGNECWCIDYEREEYKKAKKRIVDNNIMKKEDICWEDILADMMLNGYTFTLVDNEDDSNKATLSLKDLVERGGEFLSSHKFKKSWTEFNDVADLFDAMNLFEFCSSWKEIVF